MLAILVAVTLQMAPVELVGPPRPTPLYETRPAPHARTIRHDLAIDAAWIVGGQSIDAGTTIYGIHHGLDESNPLVGRHPSNATIIATKAALAGAGILFCREARKAGHPRLARIVAVVLGVVGGSAGAMNTWNVATDGPSDAGTVYFPPQE